VLRLTRNAVEELLQTNTRFAHELAHLQTVRADALERARDEWAEAAESESVLLPISMRKPQSEPDEADA
jgi:anti-sigma factor RsiW